MAGVDDARLVAAVVGVVLVVSVVAAAFVGGFAGPILGDGTATTTPAATAGGSGQASGGNSGGSGGGSGGSGGGNGGSASTPQAYLFRFNIVKTETCGNTCRDVTITLRNDGTESASGVRAESRILVEDDQIWSGAEEIGTVESGESVTRTKRVKLGFMDAAKIQQNGGYVTIETTVAWDDGSRTFSQREKVT